MRSYELYVFDFDGTLANSEESLYPVFRQGFEAIGRECSPEEVGIYMHISLLQTLELAKIEGDDQKKFVEAIIEALDSEESLALIRLFDDAAPVLHQLKAQGKKLAVASNNVTSHIKKVLEKFGIESYFDVYVGSDSVAHTKPAPDMILKACHDLNVPISETIYIGDSLQDAETARAAKAAEALIDRHKEHEDFAGKRIFSLFELLS